MRKNSREKDAVSAMSLSVLKQESFL